MKSNEIKVLLKDIRRQIEAMNKETSTESSKESCRIGLSESIGDQMAAAMAAAGMEICYFAGRKPCETDYLAISGAKFPKVSPELIERFNECTMRLEEDSASEVRYELMSKFFHKGAIEDAIQDLEKSFKKKAIIDGWIDNEEDVWMNK